MPLGKTHIANLIRSHSSTEDDEEDREFQRILEEKEQKLRRATIELEQLDFQLVESKQELTRVSTSSKLRLKKEQEALHELETEQCRLQREITKREHCMETIEQCMAKLGLRYAKTSAGEKCLVFSEIRIQGEEAIIYFHKIYFNSSVFQVAGFKPQFPGHKKLLKMTNNFPGFIQLVRERFLKLKEKEEEGSYEEDESTLVLADATGINNAI